MLKIKVDIKDLDKRGDQFCQALYNKIQAELMYEGEDLVSHARNLPPFESYNDQTGNLRSSIGYATYANGTQTNKSTFPMLMDGKDGKQAGEQCIESNKGGVTRCTHGLVVVAGMEYAPYVEKCENKNVLAKTELKATQDMVTILENIKKTFKI